MRVAARTGLVLAALLAAGAARSADLDPTDNPAPPPDPAAEIRRGADAAFGCQIGSAHPLDGDALVQCLQSKQQTNRIMTGRAFDAFDAGLWYFGRGRLRALDSVAPSGTSKGNLHLADVGLAAAEMACAATDADIWRALHPPRQMRPPPPAAPVTGGAPAADGR